MTLTHDSQFDLGAYVKLVESFWNGTVSQQTFTARAIAMGADVETVASVIANLKAVDQVED